MGRAECGEDIILIKSERTPRCHIKYKVQVRECEARRAHVRRSEQQIARATRVSERRATRLRCSPAHAVCASTRSIKGLIVLVLLQVVSLLELDLRELGERAAAQLHHLVPQRLGQAEALLERHRPRARRRGPLALGAL